MTGIYCIENTVTGKKYIGQSVDIEKRWTQHKQKLRNNAHSNVYLQKAWNKHGENNFVFYVVELCDVESLDNREIYYINHFDSKDNGYNMTYGGEGTRGTTHTDEWKERMRILNTGKTMSEASKVKMSLAKKGKPRFSVCRKTEKVLEGYKKLSQALKGRNKSKEHCLHISEAKKGSIPWNKGMKMPDDYIHPFKGRHHTEETKKKLSEARKGTKKSIEERLKVAKKVMCVETGEIFPSITFAAEKYGVSIYAISNVLRGKAQTSCNLHWKYADEREVS